MTEDKVEVEEGKLEDEKVTAEGRPGRSL